MDDGSDFVAELFADEAKLTTDGATSTFWWAELTAFITFSFKYWTSEIIACYFTYSFHYVNRRLMICVLYNVSVSSHLSMFWLLTMTDFVFLKNIRNEWSEVAVDTQSITLHVKTNTFYDNPSVGTRQSSAPWWSFYVQSFELWRMSCIISAFPLNHFSFCRILQFWSSLSNFQ